MTRQSYSLPSTIEARGQFSDDRPALQTGMRAADEECEMATAFRILLWALVLIAPGGILLAPLLAAHELRRRSANRAPNPELLGTDERLSVVAVASAR
jgi:hypothetical protein